MASVMQDWLKMNRHYQGKNLGGACSLFVMTNKMFLSKQLNQPMLLMIPLFYNNSSLAHEGWFESINNHYMI